MDNAVSSYSSSRPSVIETSARDAVHQFSHFAMLAESGIDVIIKRRGRPALKLTRTEPLTQGPSRATLIAKAIAFRAAKPYSKTGKKFDRSEAYA